MPNHFATLLVFAGALLPALNSQAQDALPAPPLTRMEAFETNTGTVIIKGATPAGSIATGQGTITVVAKADSDLSTGLSQLGIRIVIAQQGLPEQRTFVDYDELPAFLKAIDYLGKIDWTVTPLATFDAVFTTRGGFRVAAYGARRSGNIEFSVASSPVTPRVTLVQMELAQFRALIDSAKRALDSLGSK